MKKRKKRFDCGIFYLLIMIILAVLVFGGLIATEIYVWITYSNTPISEIPLWALIFMFRRR